MGRPIGSLNRQKPFADALWMEICAGNDPRHLRAPMADIERPCRNDAAVGAAPFI